MINYQNEPDWVKRGEWTPKQEIPYTRPKWLKYWYPVSIYVLVVSGFFLLGWWLSTGAN